jgi:hypothetical protein
VKLFDETDKFILLIFIIITIMIISIDFIAYGTYLVYNYNFLKLIVAMWTVPVLAYLCELCIYLKNKK